MSVGWESEWRVALRRRRLLALDVGVPLLLVAALLAGAAPPYHTAAVAAVLFTVFGVFGSAVPLVRDGDHGLLLRWVLAGVPPRRFLAGRLAAQSVLDLLQLLPALLLLTWGAGPVEVAAVAGALLVGLLVANAVGAWIAAAARSLAEAALFGAVTALLLLHLAGVFRTPRPGTWQAAAEALTPLRPLHESLLEALGLAGPSGHLGPALTVAAAFLTATWIASPVLLRRLSTDDPGPV